MASGTAANIRDNPPISLPPQLKLLNMAGPLLERLGIGDIQVRPDFYMQLAQKQLGLKSFGDFDLYSPLAKLLYTLKYDADLSLFGRIACRKMILRNLSNNLLMQQQFERHPEIAEVEVEEPLIIICTPRTGSTLLHNLLNQHSNVRSPKMWELHRPCPPPEPQQEFCDKRIRQSAWEFGLYYRLIPEMKAIHYFAPEAIEECTHLFSNIFSCRLSFSTLANSNTYTDWIWQENMTEAYQSYKKHLQILKYHYQQNYLVLKSPVHLLQLDALAKAFPRAKIVHLHRDPATAAGSFCSLTEAVQISLRRNVDTKEIGNMWRIFWTPAMLDSIAWRQRSRLEVLDINFKQLVSRPVETIEHIFKQLDWNLPESLTANITQYLQDHPKDEYGIHNYSLARYGLDRGELYHQYQAYIDYFQVPLEGRC
jgi:LPS sulfotransferase NodH